jgi:hypothetical protein
VPNTARAEAPAESIVDPTAGVRAPVNRNDCGSRDEKNQPAGSRHARALQRIVDLYDAWHEAEAGAGYDEESAEWRAELPERDGASTKAGSKD